MEKEFIPYEQALALNELGFDEPCYGAYNSKKQWERASSDYWDNGSLFRINEATTSELEVLAPLYQQAFRWFREKCSITFYIESPYHKSFLWRYSIELNDLNNPFNNSDYYNTYEEAELACLKKLIEIAKKQK